MRHKNDPAYILVKLIKLINKRVFSLVFASFRVFQLKLKFASLTIFYKRNLWCENIFYKIPE